MRLDAAQERKKLGQKVKARRLSLGMSKDAAAAAGHMSTVTWTRIENGEPVRELSYFGVARVLGWPHPACVDFIEQGIEPVPVEELIGNQAVPVDDAPGESKAVTLRGVLDELDRMDPSELSALAIRAVELIAERQSQPGDKEG